MGEDVIFTIRLTSDDWDPSVRAWRCPALDIPSAFIKEAFDSKGKPLAVRLLEIDKGPARVSWKGPGEPEQIVLVVGLSEELSPKSQERYWQRFAIIVPIIVAIIGGIAAYLAKSSSDHPAPTHTLRLYVDPTDSEASGLPPAKITVNSQQLKTPVEYKIVSDILAVVDVSKAFQLAKSLGETNREQKSIAAGSVTKINVLRDQINAVAKEVTDVNRFLAGNVCPGGASGTPIPNAGRLVAQTTGLSDRLNAISADLQTIVTR